jgi:hypothetical protein
VLAHPVNPKLKAAVATTVSITLFVICIPFILLVVSTRINSGFT